MPWQVGGHKLRYAAMLQSSSRAGVQVSMLSLCARQSTPGSWFLFGLRVFGFRLLVLLCGFCRGPLLEHRVPPVIAGRGGCLASTNLSSSALPCGGSAAGGTTCCVAEENETVRRLSGPDPPMNLQSETTRENKENKKNRKCCEHIVKHIVKKTN